MTDFTDLIEKLEIIRTNCPESALNIVKQILDWLTFLNKEENRHLIDTYLISKEIKDTETMVTKALNVKSQPSVIQYLEPIKSLLSKFLFLNHKGYVQNYSRSLNNEIKSYHQALLETEDSIQSQIQTYRDELLEGENSIKADIQDSQDKITGFYRDVFGTYEEGKSKPVKSGYKNEITDLIKSVKLDSEALKTSIEEKNKECDKTWANIQKKWNEFEDKQRKKIDGLLNDATAENLSRSFVSSYKKHKEQAQNWNCAFIGSLIGIILITLFTLWDFSSSSFGLKSLSTFSEALLHLIQIIPIEIPFIWFALHSSKRGNIHVRLAEEYLHKDNMAKSYIGFKGEIEDQLENSETGKKILERFLEKTIEANANNPSNVIDKHKEPGSPIEALKQGASGLKR